jgi:hypothetical protein
MNMRILRLKPVKRRSAFSAALDVPDSFVNQAESSWCVISDAKFAKSMCSSAGLTLLRPCRRFAFTFQILISDC